MSDGPEGVAEDAHAASGLRRLWHHSRHSAAAANVASLGGEAYISMKAGAIHLLA